MLLLWNYYYIYIYIYDYYAIITLNVIKENDTRLRDPYNQYKRFETLIDQAKDSVEYAAIENLPIY